MKAYFATIRMGFRESGYFGVMNILGSYGVKALRLFGLLLIWRALFAGGVGMEGMTREQAYTYTLLSAVLAPLLDVRTQASNVFHEGEVLSLFQRPMGIFGQLTAQSMGSWGTHLLFFGLPVLAAGGFLGINLLPASPWAPVSLILSVSLGFCVDLLFTCMILRAGSTAYHITVLRSALGALFTGALIPFAALPFGLGKWLSPLPMGALAGAPLAIAAGLSAPFPALWIQLGWNALLWPAAALWFRSSRKRMVAYGG